MVQFQELVHYQRRHQGDRVRHRERAAAARAGHQPVARPAGFRARRRRSLVQAVEQANAAGIIVVASAGNFGEKQSDGSVGYMGITSPGNAPSAIAVGAVMTGDTTTRDDDQVAPYSSRGPTWFDAYAKPDVVAPGHQLASDTDLSSYLYTLLANNHASSKNGQPLLELSGSSMATAVTSGVVALILEAHNENGFNHPQPLTPNLVKGILEYSAIAIPGDNYLTQGVGEINAAGAIELANRVDTSKPLGATWAKNVTPVTVIGGETYFWAQHVICGAWRRRTSCGARWSALTMAMATTSSGARHSTVTATISCGVRRSKSEAFSDGWVSALRESGLGILASLILHP